MRRFVLKGRLKKFQPRVVYKTSESWIGSCLYFLRRWIGNKTSSMPVSSAGYGSELHFYDKNVIKPLALILPPVQLVYANLRDF